MRNSGDCDVTQRLEQRFSPQVRQALVKVYIHAGLTLDEMELRGPILDWESWKKAMDVVPKMEAKLDRELQMIANDPNFNCDSPQQVAWLMYDHLGLTPPEGSRSTDKTVIELFIAETTDKRIRHTLERINQRRAVGKIKSTYLLGQEASARLHNDELRCRWMLTGAVTGRLRSGGDGQPGLVNLQNLHSHPLLLNLLVSDRNWRRALSD